MWSMFNLPVDPHPPCNMEEELDVSQELVWRFSTKLDTAENSCNLCGTTFRSHLSTTDEIKNHILDEHGTVAEVRELKEFVKNYTNFVSIGRGKNDLLSGIPTSIDKEQEALVSPIWKFAIQINKENISCNFCGAVFRVYRGWTKQVKDHILNDHETTEGAFELRQYFARKEKLSYLSKLPKVQSCQKENKHCKCCASFAKEYICVQCGVKFTDQSSLNKHKKLHLNIVCEQCGFQTEKLKMNYHVQKAHRTILVSKCDHCDYKGKRGNVWNHMRNVHDGFRINCEQCDRKFTQFSDLNSHLTKVHGVEIHKNLKCEECNFSTTLRQLMTGHKKKKHENGIDKKWFCDNCKTSFRGETYLFKHRQSLDTSCSTVSPSITKKE